MSSMLSNKPIGPVKLSIASLPALDFLAWHHLADPRYVSVRFLECVDADTDLFVQRECVLEACDGDVFPYSGDAIDEDTLSQVRGEFLGTRRRVFHDVRAENRAWAASVARAV